MMRNDKSEELINTISKRAINSINEIENRNTYFLGQTLSTDDYKLLHYVENRNIVDYFNLLPDLANSLNSNVHLLDIGCGEGLAIKQIKDKYHCSVVGTSLSGKKINGLKIEKCRADYLPFDSNSFDVIVSVHGISWEPNQKKALEEVVRVLKPGSFAYIYMLQFSYSIDLFVGDRFWEDLNKGQYIEKYEFSPNKVIDGATIYCQEHRYPGDMVNGCCSEWYITIQKHML